MEKTNKPQLIPNKLFRKNDENKFSLLLLGDTSFGENYQLVEEQNGRQNILTQHGYDYGFEATDNLLSSADFIVANLETPITDIQESPFSSDKDYVHWTHVDKAPETLKKHGISLCGLANNHIFDYGEPGFEQTLLTLKSHRLPFFGAGKDSADAANAYVGAVNFSESSFKFAIITAFEVLGTYREKYNVYAGNNKSGLMPLTKEAIGLAVKKIKQADPSTFVILFPHWGGNYKWRSDKQRRMAETFLGLGVDLIVGHGAHMIQEFEKLKNKWCVYSIGNYLFNSRGRYAKLKAPPFSYITNILIEEKAKVVHRNMRLYPIVTDNLLTAYQPRGVTEEEFHQLIEVVQGHTVTEETDLLSVVRGRDKYGYYFELSLDHRQDSLNNAGVVKDVVGMVCRVVRVKSLAKHIYVWMHRAMAMEPELARRGIACLCYSPADILPNRTHVKGYLFEHGQFRKTIMPIPTVNYDWHVGTVSLADRTGMPYKAFHAFADEHNIVVFPNPAFMALAGDKWASYCVIADFDKTLVPETAIFDLSVALLASFLNRFPTVFIKPRFGSMGESIFVIRQQVNCIMLDYYKDQESARTAVTTIAQCLDKIKECYGDGEMIIQQGVGIPDYQGRVFDIRFVMLHDGQQWHAISEARVGAAQSDLSNVHQGGHNQRVADVLEQCFAPGLAQACLAKMKIVADSLATRLNSVVGGKLNEFALDFLLDTQGRIYIAEINAKPGISGVPNHFQDFFNMTDVEKQIYEEYTLRHGRYLAGYLAMTQAQYKDSSAQQTHFWIDKLGAALPLTDMQIKPLLHYAFNEMRGVIDTSLTLPSVILTDQAPRWVFLSVSDGVKPAMVYRGCGLGYKQAVDGAVELARRQQSYQSNDTNVESAGLMYHRLRLNCVLNVITVPEHDVTKPLPHERSLYGLALVETTQIAVLPETLVMKTYVTSDNTLRLKRLLKDGGLSSKQQKSMMASPYCQHYRFSMTSHSISEDGIVRLYRNHAVHKEVTAQQCLHAAIAASNYLARSVKQDGSFVYEYLPKKGEETKRYNILRHAGSVYSMLEVVDKTNDKMLLVSAEKALAFLLAQAQSYSDHANSVMCVVEDGYVKLGANGLTILAMSKYIAMTGNADSLPLLRRLAGWIKDIQHESGEFLVHKVNFKSKIPTDFVSGYYPGEAIFALSRLYQIDPNPDWLDIAVRGALFIINSRDRYVPTEKLDHDHWLLYGLNELQTLQPNDDFVAHTKRLCTAILAKQHGNPDGNSATKRKKIPEDYFGGFYNPPRSTPVAVRAEGLSAAYHLLSKHGESAQALKVYQALQRCACFQLQTQYLPESAIFLHDPIRVLGGFSKSLTDYSIRIDYVQHNISALLGLHRILVEGEFSQASTKTSHCLTGVIID